MKYLGYLFIALPFAAMFIYNAYVVGFWPASVIFASSAATVAMILVGTSMIDQGQ